MLLIGAALILTMIVGFVWLSRAAAARRFHSAVDAYVEREIKRRRSEIHHSTKGKE